MTYAIFLCFADLVPTFYNFYGEFRAFLLSTCALLLALP